MGLPVKYCVSVPQTGTVSDLRASLGSMSGIPASRISICNVVVERCSITQLYRYEDDDRLLYFFMPQSNMHSHSFEGMKHAYLHSTTKNYLLRTKLPLLPIQQKSMWSLYIQKNQICSDCRFCFHSTET